MKIVQTLTYLILIVLVFSCIEKSKYLDLKYEELIENDGKLMDISSYKNVRYITYQSKDFCIPITSVKDFDISSLTKIDFSNSNIVSHATRNSCDCIDGLNYLISGPLIQEIILNSNSIAFLDCIKLSHTVKKIELGVNNIKDSDFPLEWINKGLVKELGLGTNRINMIPDKFTTNTTLTHLNISNNRISEIPSSIKNLQALQVLSINYNFLDSLPAELIEMKNLKHIYIANNRFKTFPEVLFKMPQLKYLKIDHNYYPIINDSIKKLIKEKLPNTEVYY